MKIESIQFYDDFDNLVTKSLPIGIFEHEFVSIHDVVNCILSYLPSMRASLALIWLDNYRYIFLTENSYDVHYHVFFINSKK